MTSYHLKEVTPDGLKPSEMTQDQILRIWDENSTASEFRLLKQHLELCRPRKEECREIYPHMERTLMQITQDGFITAYLVKGEKEIIWEPTDKADKATSKQEKIEISKGNPDHRSYKFIPAQQKWWRFGS